MKKKKIILTILIILFGINCFSQTFINGDFEINSRKKCGMNLSNDTFNAYMSECYGFGKGSEIDIQDSLCKYSKPASGNWFISLSCVTIGKPDEVSLRLSSALIAGKTYKMIFNSKANTAYWQGHSTKLLVGLSNSMNSFGTQIHSLQPISQVGWSLDSITFKAPVTGMYITFRMSDADIGWNFIDNVRMQSLSVGIEDYNIKSVNIFPNPFKAETVIQTKEYLNQGTLTVYNILGQQVKQVNNIFGMSIILCRDNLPSGVYFIQLSEQSRQISFDKIVVTDN